MGRVRVAASMGPGGEVVVRAPLPWARVYDLESSWTARPRDESIVFGGSQAPRCPEDLEPEEDDE
jgi:hypothetical protein